MKPKNLIKPVRPCYATADLDKYKIIKDFKHQLVENSTLAEKLLWNKLRGRAIGHKIRRQHIIASFIVDFVCIQKRVVIEVDGSIHLKTKEKDQLRSRVLNGFGFTVIRYTNEEVIGNVNVVVLKIQKTLNAMENKKPSTTYNRTQIFCGSVKKSKASKPPSRPTPDCFTPPKGVRKSRKSQVLIHTIPDSI